MGNSCFTRQKDQTLESAIWRLIANPPGVVVTTTDIDWSWISIAPWPSSICIMQHTCLLENTILTTGNWRSKHFLKLCLKLIAERGLHPVQDTLFQETLLKNRR